MDDQQRRDDGMAMRRKVLGNAWVDKSVNNKTSFNADFIDLITRHAWGEIWTRPHFDERTRRVLVIGTMVALGQWDEFRLHVRAALAEGGASVLLASSELEEMMSLCDRYLIVQRGRIVGELPGTADKETLMQALSGPGTRA